MDEDPASQTGNACGRCGKREMTLMSHLPKSPGHDKAHQVFACDGCGSIEWVETPPPRTT